MDNNKNIPPEGPINPKGSDEHRTADTLMEEEDDAPKVGQKGPDYKKYAVIGCVILLIAVINLRSCFKKDETTVVVEPGMAQNAPDYHDVTKHEIVETKPAVTTTVERKEESKNDDPELLKLKMAYLAQQQKMYRMRQSAPIDLLDNSGGVGADLGSSPLSLLSSGVAKAASGLFGGGTQVQAGSGRLPLSQSQIEALRQSQSSFGKSGSDDANLAFQNKAKNSLVDTAEAVSIPHQDETVAQGTLISGVLQTAINTDLPGMLKANVSEDIYSINGNKKLIPKGSILVGEYSSGLVLGQKRVLVMWTRLIRPDGVYVMLGSPGTDSLGRSGLGADVLETHFWERFGQASLLSIIGTGIATAGVDDYENYNSATAYRMMLAGNFQESANSTMSATMSQKPTIHVYQGSKINVFVNRDLSFYDLTQSQEEN